MKDGSSHPTSCLCDSRAVMQSSSKARTSPLQGPEAEFDCHSFAYIQIPWPFCNNIWQLTHNTQHPVTFPCPQRRNYCRTGPFNSTSVDIIVAQDPPIQPLLTFQNHKHANKIRQNSTPITAYAVWRQKSNCIGSDKSDIISVFQPSISWAAPAVRDARTEVDLPSAACRQKRPGSPPSVERPKPASRTAWLR